MNKIIIADILTNVHDGKSTGHYFALARNYQKMFGDRVVVAGGPVYTASYGDNHLLNLPYNSSTGIKGRLHTLANAIRLFNKAKGDIIVLQQCTVITTFLCIALFYHRKSKLYLIQYSKEGLRSKIGRFLFGLCKNKIDGIMCPNDAVGELFGGIPYCVVPDYIYVEDNKPLAAPLYSEKKYDYCVVGRISPEKGVPEIARKLAGTIYKAIIAGKSQTQELADELHSICDSCDNIELKIGYVSDEDYLHYLHQSRYAILNYQGEYSQRSSGVVFDTLFNNVPVIGHRCKSLQFIEDYGAGELFSNITEWEPAAPLNEHFYQTCLSNINKYRLTHKAYIEKLNSFLMK